MKDNIKILIVDDEIPICNYLGKEFRRLGFETVLAHDGVAALEMYQAHQPDAMILDIKMPRKDGLEVLKELRGQHQAEIPIVILSAKDQLHQVREGMEAGATDYLCKPLFPDQIVDKVLKCLPK